MKLNIEATEQGFLVYNGRGAEWEIVGASSTVNSAARPMEHLLSSLGTCAGLDVKHILKKQKVELQHWQININSKRSESVPAVFEIVELSFEMNGADEDANKIKRAIELSVTKYCSAIHSLHSSVSVVVKINLNKKAIHEFTYRNPGH